MSKVRSIYWNVSINGKTLSLDKKRCISSIDLEELCDGSNTCSIRICDPNFIFIEDNIFIEEATVSVVIGWHGDTHRETFDGYISAIDLDFPEEGYPSLTIFCLDESHVMNRKKKKRSWDNVTNADVVRKIAREYGFKCVIEQGYDFKVEETISQSDNTDIEFCESLAENERDPFMCKLIGDTLYYVKKGILQSPSAILHYKEFPYDIISFKPQINKEDKKEEVSHSDINTDDKTVDSATTSNKLCPRDTQGTSMKTDISGDLYYKETVNNLSSGVE